MGVVVHHYVSVYSFVMGVLWFNTFVLLGVIMRKLKFPIKFSAIPLLLLLALSVLRMFIIIDMPGAEVVFSERLYPAVVNLLRYEIVTLFGLSINAVGILIFAWVVVATWRTVTYFYSYISDFRPMMNWYGSSERDRYAESLLADIIGSDKRFYVFRKGCLSTPVATAIRPYIILPKIDFPPDELRVILLHEWKHIRDKDYLTGLIIEVFCCVFWWNPMVYVLRRNFRFATELKCDRFAVSNKRDFRHYLKGLLLLEKPKETDTHSGMVNAFVSNDDGLVDRLKVLALRGESRRKRILTNVVYSTVIVALFLSSYMFIVLPLFRTPPDAPIAEDFTREYSEGEGIFLAGEISLVAVNEGMFRVYVDGQFMMYIDDTHEFLEWAPICSRELD